MRETRLPQMSIFEVYSEHKIGSQLSRLSTLLDEHPDILSLLEKDLLDKSCKAVGRSGLTVENIFRCLLLKQHLQLSYEALAFHLSDSVSYISFARLTNGFHPKKSALQSTIRKITPDTFEKIQ